MGAYTTSGWQYAAAGSPLGFFIRARGYVADSRGGWVVENVLRPPAIVTQPFSQWVQVGQDATFAVVAAGTRPLTYQWFKDGTPIPDGTNSLFHIIDAQLGDEADYSVIVMNGLGAVTSTNAFLIVSPTLEMALDTTNLAWMTGGYAPWLGQTLIAHDLLDAARSGAIDHNQQSWIQTTVTGPGTLTFWWKVSSELGYDFLEFRTNTVLVERISGEVPWQQRTLSFAPGTHVLRWRYVKDDTLSKEKDRGWLDEVLFVPSQVGTPAVVSMGFNSNQFGLRITGNAGQAVVVEGSTNLVTWEVISTHVLENEPLHFVDPKAGAFPNRFYRARLQ